MTLGSGERRGSGGGDARQGRNACLISLAKVGGKQEGPGQPLPLQQGADAGGWVPRTQNKPAFYFQVLLWTLSKVPGVKEGVVGRGESIAGEGCWEGVGVDGGLTSQSGRALIRTPASEALCPSCPNAPRPLPALPSEAPSPTCSQASNIQASFTPACCSNSNRWERQQRHWLLETL